MEFKELKSDELVKIEEMLLNDHPELDLGRMYALAKVIKFALEEYKGTESVKYAMLRYAGVSD